MDGDPVQGGVGAASLEVAVAEQRAGLSRPALRATCWGTRGSVPSPGRETVVYGGNTPCLEVRPADGRCLIFDAGTGIRNLGQKLTAENASVDAELFLTHFHWDHIQGIPFFSPLYQAETRLRIHGVPQEDLDLETLFAGQMGPVYFPVPYHALAADLDYRPLQGEPWCQGGVEVAAFRVRHPGRTVGYRIRAAGATVAYIPDNELVGGDYPVASEWYDHLVEFIRGADLLFHDAMYSESEYAHRVGWGHSTYDQALELATVAGVRRLQFFHHAPERTDEELAHLLDGYRAGLTRRGSDLVLGVAVEGEELTVSGRRG